jgi:putative ABC transport system permease protein
MHFHSIWRGLIKDRRFTLVGALTVALGVGATTAVFAVVDTVLLRPFPFPSAERIVSIAETNSAKGAIGAVSPRDVEDWSRASRTIEHFGPWRDWHFIMRSSGEVVRAVSAIADPELFAVFGATAVAGRVLEPADNQPGRDHVVVMTNGFWRRQFGADRSIVGRTIDLDHEPYTVVGILSESFSLPSFDRYDIWAPVSVDPDGNRGRFLRNRRVFARLAPGVSIGQARAELDTLARQLASQYPDTNAGWGVRVVPLVEAEVGDVRPALLVMLAAVALVLLIACANLAGLLLARTAEQRGELAVRAALGASPWRLAGMLLTESLSVTTVGAFAGVLLSLWLLELFQAMGPKLPRIDGLSLDWRIVLFTIAAATGTGAAAAVSPALGARHVNLVDALRGAGRDASRNLRSVRARFVAIELALALMLLVGAGLLIRSFAGLVSLDPGFRTDHVLTLSVYPGLERYPKPAQVTAVYERIQKELSTIPGVIDVGATSAGPLFGGREPVELKPTAQGDAAVSTARYFNVLPGYFNAIGIPLVDGRDFNDRDAAGSRAVAIVNETLARRYWTGRSAVGERLSPVRGGDDVEIVGVIADAMKELPPRASEPEIYWPYLQQPRWAAFFVVHTRLPEAEITPAIRERIRRIDPEIVMGTPRSIEDLLASQVKQPRFQALLLSLFAFIAVMLAAIGVYGLTAYSVEQRVHEIGVRLSLGARPDDISRLLVGQIGRATAVGAVAGLLGAVLLSRFLQTLLFGVAPTDPVTLVVACLLLAALSLLAAWIPARRAARLDPLTALRAD